MKPWYRNLAAIAVASSMGLAGCGGQSEQELLASAKTYLAKKDEKAAIIQLKTALQKNPQSGEARFLLGEALLKSGDAAGAAAELERAHDLKHGDDQVLPLLAHALLATGQGKKVVDRYADVTLADPKAAATLKATLAAAYAAQGNIDGSSAAVEAALKSDPRNVAARLLRLRLTAGRGAFEEAIASVNSLVAEYPKDAEIWILQGELLWVARSDFDGAMKAFRQALAIDAGQMRAHTGLIQLLVQKNDLAGFKAQVAVLSKAMPDSFAARFYTVQLALAESDLKAAREGAQQLLKITPTYAPVLQLAGTIELQSNALTLAQNHLTQAVQAAPNVPVARRMLAEAQLRSGQPAKTLATLRPLLDQARPGADVLGLAAAAHLQDGDLAKAETYYALAAKADPTDPKARVALALTQVAKGNTEIGFTQLESLASTDKATYADLALISARIRRNDLDAALKAVDRLQGKLTDKPLPHLLRGRILVMRKDLVGARASLERALVLDAAYFPAMVDLAGIDVAEGKSQDALKRFEALLARDPKNHLALLAVADLRQRNGVKPEEVGTLLTDAVRFNPAEAAPRLALVDHYLAMRNSKVALATAQDAVAAMPDNLQVLDALGRAQLAAGDTQQAISTFRKLAVAQPTLPQPFLRLADAYIIRQDFAGATQSLRRALDVTPNLLAAQSGLVRIALATRRVDDAVQVARTVQRQRPTEPVGYVIEGQIHASQRAWGPAVAAYRSALERDRSTDGAIRLHALYSLAGRTADAEQFAADWLKAQPRDARFLFHLGSIAVDRKDYARAEARYRQVLAVQPDHAIASNNVAWMLVQQGKPGALTFAERANQLQPDQPVILDTLASALGAEQQWAKAVEWQRKAVALAPNAPGYRLNLAKLLIKAGERAGARVELDKLAALGDKFAAQSEVAALMKSP